MTRPRTAADLPQPDPPAIDYDRRCACGAVLLGIDPPHTGRCRNCPPTPEERAARAAAALEEPAA